MTSENDDIYDEDDELDEQQDADTLDAQPALEAEYDDRVLHTAAVTPRMRSSMQLIEAYREQRTLERLLSDDPFAY